MYIVVVDVGKTPRRTWPYIQWPNGCTSEKIEGILKALSFDDIWLGIGMGLFHRMFPRDFVFPQKTIKNIFLRGRMS